MVTKSCAQPSELSQFGSGLQQSVPLAAHVLPERDVCRQQHSGTHTKSALYAEALQPHRLRTPRTDVPRCTQCLMCSLHCLPVHVIKRIAQLYCAELHAAPYRTQTCPPSAHQAASSGWQ